jgi:hypothetical protein
MRLLIATGLAFVCLLNARQDKNQTPTKEQQATKETNDRVTEPPAIPQIAAPQGQSESHRTEKASEQEAKPFLTRGEWVMAILTAIYVGITGFYAWVSHRTLQAIEDQSGFAKEQAEANQQQFGEQLKVMTGQLQAMKDAAGEAHRQVDALYSVSSASRESANAAKAAAIAAQTSADAIVNSERALVEVVVVRNTDVARDKFEFKALNHGRTPAKITRHFFRFAFPQSPCEHDYPIPERLYDSSKTDGMIHHSKLLVKNHAPWNFETFHLLLKFGDDTMRKVRVGEVGLLGYGAVFYEDMSSQSHATYFCYWFNRLTESFEAMNDPSYYKYT